MPRNKKDEYLGKENYNNQGYLMKIVSYNKYNDIEIEFAEPYPCRIKSGVGHFLDGGVVNPYAPTSYGVGIVGNKYPTYIKETKKCLKEYGIWHSMLRRCFSEKCKERWQCYKDATCDPLWFYYENLYEWIHNQANYNSIKELDYNLDKDILFKGNQMYSPNTCVLVPQNVNKLFTKNNTKRGKYPIGVIFEEKKGLYSAYCGDGKRQRHLSYYKTVEQAFNAYKEYKESVIKRIAQEEFDKGTITEQCYQALMNYEVEITD